MIKKKCTRNKLSFALFQDSKYNFLQKLFCQPLILSMNGKLKMLCFFWEPTYEDHLFLQYAIENNIWDVMKKVKL